MARLHIHDRRERALVSAADGLLGAGAAVVRPFRRRRPPPRPRRILLLRLERIGDLLMVLPAIADVRAAMPDARLDLVVGSWNADVARSIPAVDDVELLDAAWLAREGGGLGLPALLAAARRWRTRQYDLAVNFEPDIRSNLLLAASGACWTTGYRSGGGGPLLDLALDYDTGAHTTANARRLAAAVVSATPAARTEVPLAIPPAARQRAAATLGAARPLVGVHVSGGRAIKQWPPERFAAVARQLQVSRGATILLTGAAGDRPLVASVAAALDPAWTIDASGDRALMDVAALLERVDLFITGDTGPMHLASAVGTPIVAVFGPSDPVRYAPLGANDRVVRIDLPCAPCNRIRQPPERCVGHTPDCLAGVSVDHVLSAALAVLDERGSARHAAR